MIKTIFATGGRRHVSLLSRVWSGNQGPGKKFTENDLIQSLREKFPQAAVICVTDVSGGCGTMFEVSVECTEFKGIPIIKQHRMVTEALQEQLKSMHGIRIYTAAPSER